jgi:hypothetical protein
MLDREKITSHGFRYVSIGREAGAAIPSRPNNGPIKEPLDKDLARSTTVPA